MTGLLDLICERLAGRPVAACSWQELTRVRDELDRALSAALDAKQAPLGGDAA